MAADGAHGLNAWLKAHVEAGVHRLGRWPLLARPHVTSYWGGKLLWLGWWRFYVRLDRRGIA